MVTHFEIAEIGFSIFDIGSNSQCVQCSVNNEYTHFHTFMVIFVSSQPSAIGSEKMSRWCYSCIYNTTVYNYTESTLNPDYNALYFEGIDDNITEFHLDSTFVQNVKHTHTHNLICVDKTGLPLLKGFILHVYSISVCHLDFILLS